jgi:Uma2 family endonuclease
MGSETVAWHLPTAVTLDDLTAMTAADEFHRYELSPDGVLTVTPSAGYGHALVATRLMFWLSAAGIPAEQVAQAVGLRIPGRGGVGGRIPDLIVWGKAPAARIWLPVTDVLLVVEIVSPGSQDMDTAIKRNEYAAAGIPQYWLVDQDPEQTVTMYRLNSEDYAVRAIMPLAWALNISPVDYGLV